MPHVQCQLDCEHSTSKEDTFRFKTIQLPRLHGIHDLSRKGRSKDFDLILSNLASASASIGNSGSGTTTPSSSTVHHQPSSIEGKRGRKLVTSLATKVMILVVAATLLALVASALSTPTPLLLVFLRRLHRPCWRPHGGLLSICPGAASFTVASTFSPTSESVRTEPPPISSLLSERRLPAPDLPRRGWLPCGLRLAPIAILPVSALLTWGFPPSGSGLFPHRLPAPVQRQSYLLHRCGLSITPIQIDPIFPRPRRDITHKTAIQTPSLHPPTSTLFFSLADSLRGSLLRRCIGAIPPRLSSWWTSIPYSLALLSYHPSATGSPPYRPPSLSSPCS